MVELLVCADLSDPMTEDDEDLVEVEEDADSVDLLPPAPKKRDILLLSDTRDEEIQCYLLLDRCFISIDI